MPLKKYTPEQIIQKPNEIFDLAKALREAQDCL
jgi:hypothetical protein